MGFPSDKQGVAFSDRSTTVESKSAPKVHIEIDRDLTYRFYPHFHPYVRPLVKKLVEGSLEDLQAADTLYEAEGDAYTLKVAPNSTAVALADDVIAQSASGDEAKIAKGTRFNLDDGTVISYFNLFTIPGQMVLSSPRGMRFQKGGVTHDIPFGEIVGLKNSAPVTLPNGASVILPPNTGLILHGCKPRPIADFYQDFFKDNYAPSPTMVQRPYPVKDLDFTCSGGYSVYNWELFFHVPLTIALHLSKNQRFEEAQRWFHYIFDPTDNSDGPTPERFWKVKAFQFTDVRRVEELIVNLSTGADGALKTDTILSINAWKNAPFRPHVVARYRQTAYMFKTVMAYLDNLIAWGDSLFRQDTGESVDEARQFYVMAANILGPRPQAVPKKGTTPAKTYFELRKEFNELGDALVDMVPAGVFENLPAPGGASESGATATLGSIGKTLYFGVPRNDNLLRYWDTVADRLFKIRNSLNIQGIYRQLALFDPPIDPALLARAAAAGLDVGAIVSGLNQPLPLVRFQMLVQKAAEICQEVKSLGNNLLSAMEKEDNEALAILRARHERVILEMAESSKYGQWQESIKAREGLEKSMAVAIARYTYYERLLGRKESEISIAELEELDASGIEKKKLKAAEPSVQGRTIDLNIVKATEAGGRLLSSHEAHELDALSEAQTLNNAAGVADTVGSVLSLIPQFTANLEFWGMGMTIGFGGVSLHAQASSLSSFLRTAAGQNTYVAGKAAKIGSYDRRDQEWAFQSNLAAGEITQMFKQLRAAQIREAVAERDWRTHQQQIKHAQEIERFLSEEKKGKKTNRDFYAWMKREVKGLYAQCFQFAFDIARKAERALQHELGDPGLSYLQFGYLAGKEGLLAGEKLYLDIKRMEMAYHELNQREYEMTKHASLMQVDPAALVQLRSTGRCTVRLPEELFDMDGPGQYFRRIKSVALTIPCVTGPYAGVHCTLTLLKSSIRKSPLAGDGYARTGSEDSRFSDYFGSLSSIVTSAGQNDSGMFETNLRDERYLPFELSGAISEWQLQLAGALLPDQKPEDIVRQFDYGTIADVILHIRYTAREGGDLLRKGAVGNLSERINQAEAAGSVRLLSVRQEFPTEWAKFSAGQSSTPPVATAPLELTLRDRHFPFWSKGRLAVIRAIDILAWKGGVAERAPLQGPTTAEVTKVAKNGTPQVDKYPALTDIPVSVPLALTVKVSVEVKTEAAQDLWLLVTWGKEEK